MSSNHGEPFRIPSEYPVTGESSHRQQDPINFAADLTVPLQNLSTVKHRMDSLQHFLSQSVNTNTLISKDQMNLVSSEITAAIHQIIINGSSLLSCVKKPNYPNPIREPKSESEEPDLIELDAVELLSEHVHACEICGKGFKRDANLRMHMRAHGDQYKTPEALAKKSDTKNPGRKTRFSCPYEGCNRNKKHHKFRALKSVICVRNHFKRSHCPKMYSCNRCHKKSFSVLADLKAHLKHCGVEEEARKWKCSCGNGFTRKEKLFRHISMFEGHMPVVVAADAEEDRKLKGVVAMEENEDGLFDDMLDGFESFENYCLQDMLAPTLDGFDLDRRS